MFIIDTTLAIISDEKPTANGGGESGGAKDVSSEAEARRVSVLKELGRLHRNKAVAVLSKRQDFPVWRSDLSRFRITPGLPLFSDVMRKWRLPAVRWGLNAILF